MSTRISARLQISTADLHNELLKYAYALTEQTNGQRIFWAALSAFISFGTASATATFTDGCLSAQALSALFHFATGGAFTLMIVGAWLIWRSWNQGNIEAAYVTICRSQREYVKPDGTIGVEPLIVTGPATEVRDEKTEWVENDLVQKNMRYYG